MNKLIQIALIGIATSITIVNTITLLFYDGYINLNRYGEGWLEVVGTGIVAILGMWEILKNK